MTHHKHENEVHGHPQLYHVPSQGSQVNQSKHVQGFEKHHRQQELGGKVILEEVETSHVMYCRGVMRAAVCVAWEHKRDCVHACGTTQYHDMLLECTSVDLIGIA